jgi:SPP1 family predicted phage head-tail adaptor
VSAERLPPLGTLTDRVELQRRSASAEDEGGASAVFTPLATVWARGRALGTRAAFEADARGQAISHSVVVRFRTDLGPGDRVMYRGLVLEVMSAADLNGRRAYLSCRCVERAVTG